MNQTRLITDTGVEPSLPPSFHRQIVYTKQNLKLNTVSFGLYKTELKIEYG